MTTDDDIDWYALSNGLSTVMPDGTLVHAIEDETEMTANIQDRKRLAQFQDSVASLIDTGLKDGITPRNIQTVLLDEAESVYARKDELDKQEQKR